jgi:hypothetical protein
LYRANTESVPPVPSRLTLIQKWCQYCSKSETFVRCPGASVIQTGRSDRLIRGHGNGSDSGLRRHTTSILRAVRGTVKDQSARRVGEPGRGNGGWTSMGTSRDSAIMSAGMACLSGCELPGCGMLHIAGIVSHVTRDLSRFQGDSRMSDRSANELPLSGIRVLDLSRILAGPWCTMMLGDLGAEIIKVERPDTGDDTRAWGPPFAGGESAYYLCCNRNKKSIVIDLRSRAASSWSRSSPRSPTSWLRTSPPVS